MAKKKGLGRGLDAIFDDNSTEQADSGVRTVRISMIEPNPGQPRRRFDREALAALADSIAANGVLQPIILRESGNGTYVIIAGERRWRASKLAGLVEVPAIVMDADELAAAKIAMIENLQREDLNPCEEALGYAEMMKNYSLTQEEVASSVGKSRSTVANSLRLLELPEEVLEMLASGDISQGHGRALLGLSDRTRILPLAHRITEREMSVRETEAAVKADNAGGRTAPAKPSDSSVRVDYLADLEEKVTGSLGRRCRIFNTPKKKVIQLEFADNEDLEELLTSLCGGSPIED